MILAFQDSEIPGIQLLIAGALAHGLCRTTERMQERQQSILRASLWIGGSSGVLLNVMHSRPGDLGLIGLVVEGLLIGFLISMGTYLGLSVTVFLWQHVVGVPFRWIGRGWQRRKERRKQRKAARDHESLRQSQAGSNQFVEEQKRLRTSEKQAEQKRREKARFECQMLYDRLAKQLQGNFPPQSLAQYFKQYLSDDHAANEVEQRASLLQEMMNELAGGPVKKSTPATLVDLRAEFAERRHAVQSAGFDEAQAAAMLASLAREEERAIREWQMR